MVPTRPGVRGNSSAVCVDRGLEARILQRAAGTSGLLMSLQSPQHGTEPVETGPRVEEGTSLSPRKTDTTAAAL